MPARVRIRFVPDTRAIAALTGRGGIVGRYIASVGVRTLGVAKTTAPVDTGRLRASIGGRFTGGSSRATYRIGTTVPYAMHVHDGTHAHVITPRRRKVLRFKVGGRTVFARRVMHPGTRANPWLWRSLVTVAGGEGFRVERDV